MIPHSKPWWTLNGYSATVVFLFYLLLQFLGGLGIALLIRRGPSIHIDENVLISGLTVAVIFLSGAIVIGSSILVFRGQVRNTRPIGAAWFFGSWIVILRAFVIGMSIAVCWSIVALFMPLGYHIDDVGPITRISISPGFPQNSWLLLLLISPVIEEPIFRGILFGGYYYSLGSCWAAVLTTTLFILLHITETAYFWPAIVPIIFMSMTALWCRLHFRAIGPAIAVHLGYNVVIGFVVSLVSACDQSG